MERVFFSEFNFVVEEKNLMIKKKLVWEEKMPLTFVTGNPKKLEEVKAIFGNSFKIVSKDIDRKFSVSLFLKTKKKSDDI